MKPIKQAQYQPLRTERREMFSVPFYHMRYNHNLSDIVRDVRTVVAEVEKRYDSGDTQHNYTTYFDRDLFHKHISNTSWAKDLSTSLKDTYVDIMHKEFLKSPRQLGLKRSGIHLHMWVNRYTEEHTHNAHNHKGSIISGTFYVKTGDPCAPIIFESPMEGQNFLFQTADRHHAEGQHGLHGVPAITHEYHFNPRDGDIALWPSYVYHHVPKQEQQEERISISFNLAHYESLNYDEADEVLEDIDYGFLHHD